MVWCSRMKHIILLGLPRRFEFTITFSLLSVDLSCSTWVHFSSCSYQCSWFSWAYSSSSKEEKSFIHKHLVWRGSHAQSQDVDAQKNQDYALLLPRVADYNKMFTSFCLKRKFSLKVWKLVSWLLAYFEEGVGSR